MPEPNTVDIERRLREKSEAFVLKPHLSGKSEVCKNFSLAFGTRHDVHDSASYDFFNVLWIGLRLGSGRVQELLKLAGRVGHKIWTRVQLWFMDHVYVSIVLVVVKT